MTPANDATERCHRCGSELVPGAPCSACGPSAVAASELHEMVATTRMTGPAILAGKFELVRELGRGAFGVVYEARDRVLDRTVALKTIAEAQPGPGDDGAFGRRFLREARSAARLAHPSIVTIHEAGHADGVAFIAMELVRGRSLRALLAARGRLPLSEVLALAAPLAGALDHAHAEGVVHRDVKPENVLVRESDGAPKIADFGIAKALHGQSLAMTEPGSLVGTPCYMSPEQVRGLEVDGRSDQFAFGAVLYELLTGRPPFLADSVPALFHRILDEAPREPSEIATGIPPGVGAALLRALAKRPADRHESCGALVRAMAEAAVPVDSPPAPERGKPSAASASRRAPAGVVLGLAGLLGAALLVIRHAPGVPQGQRATPGTPAAAETAAPATEPKPPAQTHLSRDVATVMQRLAVAVERCEPHSITALLTDDAELRLPSGVAVGRANVLDVFSRAMSVRTCGAAIQVLEDPVQLEDGGGTAAVALLVPGSQELSGPFDLSFAVERNMVSIRALVRRDVRGKASTPLGDAARRVVERLVTALREGDPMTRPGFQHPLFQETARIEVPGISGLGRSFVSAWVAEQIALVSSEPDLAVEIADVTLRSNEEAIVRLVEEHAGRRDVYLLTVSIASPSAFLIGKVEREEPRAPER